MNSEVPINCRMETIAPIGDWVVQIDHTIFNLSYLKTEDTLNRRQIEPPIIPPPHETERSLYQHIEEDPLRSFNYIQREAVKTVVFITRIALFLSAATLDKICGKIFSRKDVDDQFVKLWYEHFFCVYFKRVYSWSSLHLLIKASKAYPAHFKITIKIMLMDTYLQNNILLDYIETLNKEDCTNLMKSVKEIPLTCEQFDHNLLVIYLVFKKCDKSESIIQYVHVNLEANYKFCANNKNYGRLLLCFIENLSGFNVNIRNVKQLAESHCTSYKSACMTALEKFSRDLIDVQLNFQDRPRIFLPREVKNCSL